MKRFLTLALVGALVLGASSVLYANVCAFDAVPAATLLYPFVVYNYEQGAAGYDTLFSVTNVSSEAQIVHFTVWTDFSVAILDFNVILTGYDVQNISIRDILKTGQLPVTLYSGHTTSEGAFEDGPVSINNTVAAWDPVNLSLPEPTSALGARCATNNVAYPGNYTQKIPTVLLGLFETWLQSSQTHDWYNSDFCDGSGEVDQGGLWYYNRTASDDTWMYITADVVETCNKTFPDQAAYWGGEARYDNVLIGDVIYVNESARYSEAVNAIHLEADEFDLGLVTNTDINGNPYSFFYRYSGGDDGREPLPTAWGFRIVGTEDGSLATYIRAFKASTTDRQVVDAVWDDSVDPGDFIAKDTVAYTYYAWDEEENVVTSTSFPWSSPQGGDVVPNLLPLETQQVAASAFSTVDPNGWMLFIWPYSNVDPLTPGAFPDAGDIECDDFFQTWMGVQYVLDGQWSAALDGAVMANFNCFPDQILPNLGVNYDYIRPLAGN